MATYRREFLQKISGAAFLTAAPSILPEMGQARCRRSHRRWELS